MRRPVIIGFLIAVFMLATPCGQTGAVELHPLLRSDLRPVSCQRLLTSKRLMVAIVFGQSNSANYGERPMAARGEVYTFYEGICFHASDPLPGASGQGGSVWTRLGDSLIEEGMFESVLFVPIGVGGAKVEQWAPGGRLHGRILLAIARLRLEGFEPTHMLWHQGEADYSTPAAIYRAQFRAMLGNIRAQGVDAPIFVSVATWYNNLINQEIEQAQRELVDEEAGVFAGPDTDRLGIPYRYDGVHFNDEGLREFARMWLDAIRNSSSHRASPAPGTAPSPPSQSVP